MKKNGFVFMETIVVISVLSITLLMLFASYSYILRKSRDKNTFDTTESIYKTYYVKSVIDSYKTKNGGNGIGILYYVSDKKNSECTGTGNTFGSDYSYTCNLNVEGYNGYLKQIKNAFEVDKIYYLNPNKIIKSKDANTWLNTFDATTIDYIRDIGDSIDSYILIVKYKKIYSDGSYEVIHSSMEVNS